MYLIPAQNENSRHYNMTPARAILVSGLLLAVTYGLTSRWEISSSSTLTFRLDRWTGQVTMCNEKNDAILDALNGGRPIEMKCRAP